MCWRHGCGRCRSRPHRIPRSTDAPAPARPPTALGLAWPPSLSLPRSVRSLRRPCPSAALRTVARVIIAEARASADDLQALGSDRRGRSASAVAGTRTRPPPHHHRGVPHRQRTADAPVDSAEPFAGGIEDQPLQWPHEACTRASNSSSPARRGLTKILMMCQQLGILGVAGCARTPPSRRQRGPFDPVTVEGRALAGRLAGLLEALNSRLACSCWAECSSGGCSSRAMSNGSIERRRPTSSSSARLGYRGCGSCSAQTSRASRCCGRTTATADRRTAAVAACQAGR